jgi:hypothetical protein
MYRVARLVSLYKENTGITLDMLDSIVVVTIEDLENVLAAAQKSIPEPQGDKEPYSDLNGIQGRLDKAGFKTLYGEMPRYCKHDLEVWPEHECLECECN